MTIDITLLIARAKVVLRNGLLYLMAVQMMLTYLVSQGAFDMWPQVLNYVLLALTGITSVITFIRRVTPVDPDERGLLPIQPQQNWRKPLG